MALPYLTVHLHGSSYLQRRSKGAFHSPHPLRRRSRSRTLIRQSYGDVFRPYQQTAFTDRRRNSAGEPDSDRALCWPLTDDDDWPYVMSQTYYRLIYESRIPTASPPATRSKADSASATPHNLLTSSSTPKPVPVVTPTAATSVPVDSAPSLSSGAKAGIGVGSTCGFLVLLLLAWITFRCIRKRRSKHESSTVPIEESQEMDATSPPSYKNSVPQELDGSPQPTSELPSATMERPWSSVSELPSDVSEMRSPRSVANTDTQ